MTILRVVDNGLFYGSMDNSVADITRSRRSIHRPSVEGKRPFYSWPAGPGTVTPGVGAA